MNREQLAIAAGVGIVLGFGLAVIVARRRIKRLPWWRKLLLALAVRK